MKAKNKKKTKQSPLISSELLACPFCGSDKVHMMGEGFLGSPAVTCEKCRTVLGYPALNSNEKARKQWNKRII